MTVEGGWSQQAPQILGMWLYYFRAGSLDSAIYGGRVNGLD